MQATHNTREAILTLLDSMLDRLDADCQVLESIAPEHAPGRLVPTVTEVQASSAETMDGEDQVSRLAHHAGELRRALQLQIHRI